MLSRIALASSSKGTFLVRCFFNLASLSHSILARHRFILASTSLHTSHTCCLTGLSRLSLATSLTNRQSGYRSN
jgi:hypothetical protein